MQSTTRNSAASPNKDSGLAAPGECELDLPQTQAGNAAEAIAVG
jgi:hypothetical protein